MDKQSIILAGLTGTAVMTAFMYGLTFLTQRVMKVVKILGTMLTFQTSLDGQLSDTPLAIAVGLVAHYLIGIGFTFVYAALWQADLGHPTFAFGVVAGFFSGMVGVLVWRLFFAIHPKAPTTIPLQSYLVTLLLAHVVFGVAVVATYQFLTSQQLKIN